MEKYLNLAGLSRYHTKIKALLNEKADLHTHQYAGSSSEGGAANSANSVPWSGVTNKPTTLSGYGITDAVASGGTVTSVTAGTGLSGGTITSSGTISHTAHTGDVTGSTKLTIANSAVTNSKIAAGTITNDKMARGEANTIKMHGGCGYLEDMNRHTFMSSISVTGTFNYLSTEWNGGKSIELGFQPSFVLVFLNTLTCYRLSDMRSQTGTQKYMYFLPRAITTTSPDGSGCKLVSTGFHVMNLDTQAATMKYNYVAFR